MKCSCAAYPAYVCTSMYVHRCVSIVFMSNERKCKSNFQINMYTQCSMWADKLIFFLKKFYQLPSRSTPRIYLVNSKFFLHYFIELNI